jgi:hypothetical protein
MGGCGAVGLNQESADIAAAVIPAGWQLAGRELPSWLVRHILPDPPFVRKTNVWRAVILLFVVLPKTA